jgi:hypothetical protein
MDASATAFFRRRRPYQPIVEILMKNLVLKLSLCAAVAVGGLGICLAQEAKPAPKRLLIVTVCKTYRHASIDTGEKVVAAMGAKTGEFTVDYARTDEDLATKMTPEALKNYDGVFFLSSNGEIPLPDEAGFLNWIKSGKAFIGAHAATDTLHGHGPGADPYIEMIGGEFTTHVTAPVVCINDDPKHPANAKFGETYPITDEIYMITKNFSRDKVHMLLHLDKAPGSGAPGYFPISWCKKYGDGNVFYTALGHGDNVWESPDFQAHVLGGIEWALGLKPGDATPQAAPAPKP